MKSEECKYPYEQRGQRTESEIQNRVFCTVMMCRMRQVTGKTTIGIGVTFLTGFNNIFISNLGFWMIIRFYIMRTMTIRSLSRFHISQGVSFSMHSLQISFREILMTITALVGHLGEKLIFFNVRNPVGGMAIFTIGEFFI